MDEMTAFAACAAVHNDDNEAENWFAALATCHQGLTDPSDWVEFQTALAASVAAGEIRPETVEQFVMYLDPDSARMDIVADLASQNPDELLDVYRGWLAQANEPQGEPQPEDEAVWYEFLRENGRYWDRTAENWTAFREWFLYTAAAAGVGTLATNFLDWAQEQPDPVAVFVEYGVTFDEAAESAEDAESAEAAVGDIVELGQDEEEAEQDAPEELIDLSAEALENLIEQRFAQAGADDDEIAAVTGTGDAQAETAPEDAESLSVEEAVEQIAGDIIPEFRSQHPEFEGLTDEDLREMLAEVIAEEAGAAQPA